MPQRAWWSGWAVGALAGTLLLGPMAGSLAAQAVLMPPAHQPTAIRWWHVVAAAGLVGTLMLVDEPAQRWVQDHRSDGVANVVRHMGQVEVFGTVGAGLLAAGWLSGDRKLQGASYRVAGSLLLAGIAVGGAKLAIGRRRPGGGAGAGDFRPFSGQDAMPSGHTTIAFALATALSDEIHHPVATVGLYALAGATGWSRLNDDKHWLSDVTAGTLLGIASAKVVSGRWRILGIRPPTLISTAGGAGLAWSGTF